MKRTSPPPEVCPVCGEDVPRNARACPHCGADDRSGWNDEDTSADGLDLPDENFDYDEFMEREFGVRRRKTKIWVITGIILLVAILVLVLARVW